MIKKNYLKLPIKKLKNYKFNNKIHTEADIDEIVKSIQKCEYLSPIVIDEKFEIINWHWRKEALKKLWYEEIEVLQITGLTELQKKQARLLDNKTVMLSKFNLENIKLELAEINDLELNNLFSDMIFEKVDFDEIYQWMPEYKQEDLAAKYKISVNFKTLEDLMEFWDMIAQKVTEQTKWIWFPYVEKADLKSSKIIDEK